MFLCINIVYGIWHFLCVGHVCARFLETWWVLGFLCACLVFEILVEQRRCLVSSTNVWYIWELVSGIYNWISCFQRCSLCLGGSQYLYGVFKWVFKCSMGLGDVFLQYSMSLEVLNVSLGYSMGFLNVQWVWKVLSVFLGYSLSF